MNSINVIPKPEHVTFGVGTYKLLPNTVVSGVLLTAAQALLTYTPLPLTLGDAGAVVFHLDEALEEEAYRLVINEMGISVFASTQMGGFYAVQTIRQLGQFELLENPAEISFPCVTIEDKPRFGYRSFMLDEARHFFGKEYVKRTLDMMALVKLNTFHWHLTDDQGWRAEIKKHPLLTQVGSVRSSTQLNLAGTKTDKTEYGKGLFYTHAELREVVDYAKKLHITVVPEVDIPGHLIAAIACYPELSCFNEKIEVSTKWGVLDTIGCCGKEELYRFVKDVIDELTEVFDGPYFHIGGDEVPKKKWKQCPHCQAKIKELGLKDEDALQSYFNNEIEQYLKEKGKTTIAWNETGNFDALSGNAIVQWWHLGYAPAKVEEWLVKGNRLILSMTEYVYLDHLYSMKDLRKTYSLDYDVLSIPQKYEGQIVGIEAPLWVEYIRTEEKADFNTYPRMMALAEINWTTRKNKNFDDFEKRLATFTSILEKWHIGYAPREVYLLSGFKGFLRKNVSWKDWAQSGDIELTRYKKKQQKRQKRG